MLNRINRLTYCCLPVAVVAFVLAAAPATAGKDKVGKSEGVVDIVAWPGYIERGETDKAYD